MKVEEQVCSLELSKRLKELGVKQESLWWWVQRWGRTCFTVKEKEWTLTERNTINGRPCFPAFSIAELGKMLPHKIEGGLGEYLLTCGINSDGRWCVEYVDYNRNDSNYSKVDTSEANARAKMLIELIENGYVKKE